MSSKNQRREKRHKAKLARKAAKYAKNKGSFQPPSHVEEHSNSAPASDKAENKKHEQSQVQIANTHGLRRAVPIALPIISGLLLGLASIFSNDRHVALSHIATWTSIVLAAAWFAIIYDNHVFKRRLPRKRTTIAWRAFSAFVIVSVPAAIWYHNLHSKGSPAIFTAFTPVFNNPPGTEVAGMEWHAPYRELRFAITNQTDDDFHNVNLVIKPDQPVVDAGQDSHIKNVEVGFSDPTDLKLLGIRRDDTKSDNLAFKLASTSGVRVRCDTLPAHSILDLVMATATINERDERFVNRMDNDEGSIWFAIRGASDEIFLTPVNVRKVVISGKYSIDEQTIAVNQSVTPSSDSKVFDALQKIRSH